MGGLNFAKINHDEFMALPSNQDRLEYLQKWYAYLLKKAESCKANLESCSAGITKLAVDAANANRIVVTYQAKNGAETTTGIEPQGSDDQGIRSIEEDTTTETGRSYTITYGANSSTYTFVAKAGDAGDDGEYNGHDAKYYSSGRKQWSGRASGVTLSGKGVSGSVSGVNVGATGLSMTLGILSETYEILNVCCTGCDCKTKADEEAASGLNSKLTMNATEQQVSSNENVIQDVGKEQISIDTAGMKDKGVGLKNEVIGVKVKMETGTTMNNLG